MGSVLVDLWTDGFEPEETRDEASVARGRERVRDAAAAASLSREKAEGLVTCASELGHNQLRHARLGSLGVRCIERGGVPGVEVVAADRGPGLSDPHQAFLGVGGKSGVGLGVGLAGVRRLGDEVDVDVRLGEGTCVWVRSFAGAVARAPEVGIFGRHLPGEVQSGDSAYFARDGRHLFLAVADGLGHGPEASAGVHRALRAVAEDPWLDLDRVAGRASDAVAGGRGAVIGLARLALPATLDYLIIGDIRGESTGEGRARRFVTCPGTLGGRPVSWRGKKITRATFHDGDAVLLATDGIESRFDLASDRMLLRQTPIVIAARAVEQYARDHDDALVLVAR